MKLFSAIFCHVLTSRYSEKASSVQQEETVLNIQFVMLDCSPLKSSLVQHCNEWQTKFTQLLSDMASMRLKELHASLHDSASRWEISEITLCTGVFTCVMASLTLGPSRCFLVNIINQELMFEDSFPRNVCFKVNI